MSILVFRKFNLLNSSINMVFSAMTGHFSNSSILLINNPYIENLSSNVMMFEHDSVVIPFSEVT